jgi:hypothetical protein
MTASITKITMIVEGVRVSLMHSEDGLWQWRSKDGTAYSPVFNDEDKAINYPNLSAIRLTYI